MKVSLPGGGDRDLCYVCCVCTPLGCLLIKHCENILIVFFQQIFQKTFRQKISVLCIKSSAGCRQEQGLHFVLFFFCYIEVVNLICIVVEMYIYITSKQESTSDPDINEASGGEMHSMAVAQVRFQHYWEH